MPGSEKTARRSPSNTTVAWSVLAGAMILAGPRECVAQVLTDPQAAWQPNLEQPVALTVNYRVVRQPPSWQPRGGNPDLHGGPTTQSSLGLEFRRKSSSQSAKDLLRVQLTSDSALNFRPRSGGMVVTYRSQF